jgi:YggT family protein
MNNHDVADYVNNFFIVFIIVIFVRILISWLPRRPQNRAARAVLSFAEQTADPYLNIFRSFIKPIGGGAFALDLSPVIAVFALLIVQGILVGAIDSA